MAVEQEGIMSLPQGAPDQAMQMSLDDAYDAVRGGLQDASPVAATDMQGMLNGITPMLDELDDEELDGLIEAIQYLLENPQSYAQEVDNLIRAGILEPGTLPEEHDPEILSAVLMVLMEARRQRQAGNQRASGMSEMPMPPVQMARGGIAEAARLVASKGRGGDTMLAHINPEEARILKSLGGSGTINPATGLPEFKWYKKLNPVNIITSVVKSTVSIVTKVVKSVVNAVKKAVQSPIGRVLATVALATFLGPGAFGVTGLGLSAGASAAIASGTVTAIGGGNVKDILRSAATAYLAAPGGPVSGYVSKTIGAGAMGITNAAAASAINAGIVGTGVGLLSGQKLADAVKSGLVSGAMAGGMTGLQQGFGAQVPTAGGQATPATSKDAALQLPGEQAQAPTAPGQAPGATPAGPLSALPGGTSPGYDQIFGDIAQRGLPGATSPGYDQIYGDIAQRGLPAGGAGTQGATQTAAAPGAPRPVPGVMDSLGRIGGGIADLAQGNFRQGFEAVKGGAGDLFFPGGATPAELRNSPEYQAAKAGGATDAAALAEAGKTYNPGLLRTYGPALAAGLGTMAMTGGFTPKQAQPSALAQDLMSRDSAFPSIEEEPSRYYIQGLPGVKYDEKGRIIGSTPYSPKSTMSDVRVATPGIMPPAPPMYTPPQFALGSPQAIAQPYNTASMYTNLLPPIYRNDGGIASLAGGGYPRRTGQISGPGTETSDSIPAMLSDGEFVMTAKAVRGAGKGDRRAGAKKMYALMHQLERNASRG